MHRGYVKLWRKTLDSDVVQNPHLFLVWSYCLMKATHAKTTVTVGYQKVELSPGQFIFGRRKCAEDLLLGEQVIRTALDSLRKRENLTIKVTNKFSIISITNWHLYQQTENTNNQQSNQPVTSNQPATNHIQECKEQQETTLPGISPGGMTDEFLTFYNAYPKHEAKADAWKAWKSVNRPPLPYILAAIERQKRGRKWQEGYIKAPASWLRKGCWEDEPDLPLARSENAFVC